MSIVFCIYKLNVEMSPNIYFCPKPNKIFQEDLQPSNILLFMQKISTTRFLPSWYK